MVPYTIPCAPPETSCEQGFRMAGCLGDMRTSYIFPPLPQAALLQVGETTGIEKTNFKAYQNIIFLVFWPPKKPYDLFLRPCQGSQMLQGLAHVLQLWWRVLSRYLWTLAQYGSHPLRKKWPSKKRKSESLIVFLTLLVPSGLHAYFASNGPGNWVAWSKKILRT